MMDKTTDIVSDEAIERIHAHANFGSISKRRVVDEGVLKYAFGYHTGHTMMSILLEHGLIKTPKPGRSASGLTQKGYQYLRAMKGDMPLDAILDLMRGTAK